LRCDHLRVELAFLPIPSRKTFSSRLLCRICLSIKIPLPYRIDRKATPSSGFATITMPSDIHALAREGQARLLTQALSDNPAVINEKDADERTPLANAAASGSYETVQAVLQHNPDVEARDTLGWTPLIIATSAGNLDAVTELVGAGADVTASNDREQTALHYAASKGKMEIGQLLISKGADINARDKANQLPLHRAATTGAIPFIRLILASESTGSFKKPRLNLQDRAGNTPLHLAVESGHAEAAVVLIEAGADRQRTNSDGERPEEILGVGGQESKRVLQYIQSKCGKLD